jgi:transposase-like protein
MLERWSFILQAFDTYRDTKLHEWVSDPQLTQWLQQRLRGVGALPPSAPELIVPATSQQT